MSIYIRCAVVSFASLAVLLSSNLMARKPDVAAPVVAPVSVSAPAATLATTEQPRTN